MSFVSNILGDILGTNQQAQGVQAASNTQSVAAGQGVSAINSGLNSYNQLISPYVNAGTSALTGQQNLLGLNGNAAQQSAYNSIQSSPAYTSALQSGQDAILGNASATGGLRGGNTQSALAQFSPALLSSLIQQQYGNLGTLTSTGANAASATGAATLGADSSIANLLQQQGAATAGGQIAAGNNTANTFGSLLKLGSTVAGFF